MSIMYNLIKWQTKLTQTPAEEDGKGKNRRHEEHSPFDPLVLCSVWKQRHHEQANEREDARNNHNVHALVLESLQVVCGRNEYNNINS